jgi:predicted ATPase/DNA-binding CsgD family transcriptional regulator
MYNSLTMPKSKLFIVPDGLPYRRQIPNNLPSTPGASRLVGRERDLEEVLHLLTVEPEVWLLTLVGPGGVGKTRLALRAAEEALESFEDGVYLVELAAVSDPDLVVPTIAATLRVRESPGSTLLAALKQHLQGKRVLLVLDNFEQLLGPEFGISSGADKHEPPDSVPAGRALAELVACCPGLKLLVTSRAALHLSIETTYTVSPLAMPERGSRLGAGDLGEYGAVSLFVQRAEALRTGFQLTDANAEGVAEICRRVDGLPLAIELVAARVRLLTPEAILSRLEHRLRLLTGGARDLPARHQTLRSTIAWSYDLLDDAEKTLFSRLAVFAGGCTLEAIEGVCFAGDRGWVLGVGETTGTQHPVPNPGNKPPAPRNEGEETMDVLDAVASLVDKSLIQVMRNAESPHTQQNIQHSEGSRFMMLETIHEYVGEKLQESGEAEELRRRHALYFLALAEEAEPALQGTRQAEWLDRLEDEHDNLRAALAWSRGEATTVGDTSKLEIGLRIGGALLSFWDTRGHFTEGRAHLAPLLSRSASFGPTASRARAIMTAGRLAWQQGDLAEARSLYEESLETYRTLGDKLGVTYALNGLANTVKLYGDYAAAAAHFAQSLKVARELGDKQRIAAALENLGEMALAQGDYDKARELDEEGLRLVRELDDKYGIGISLQGLGIVLLRQGDLKEARKLFEEALALYREVGEKRFSVVVLYELGQVAHAEGDDAQAAKLFTESLTSAHSLGDKIFAGLDLGGLATVAGIEGRSEWAARLFGASDAIIDTTGYLWFQADRAIFDRGKAAAYAELGDERWHRAVEEGRALSLDEAVACALEPGPEPVHAFAADTTTEPTTAAAPALPPLTTREIEVLQLVAEGLTTRQVAERLFLSVRTVENHLRSIYGKLNVSTRSAATRIAVEHGLK